MAGFDFTRARYDERTKHVDDEAHGRITVADLLAQRALIDSMLPDMNLGAFDLNAELVRQFRVTQALQTQVLNDDDIPANQRAQVVNACAAILADLQKTQEKFYKAERFKKIEVLLIKTLRKLPVEVAQEFIDEYERTLETEV